MKRPPVSSLPFAALTIFALSLALVGCSSGDGDSAANDAAATATASVPAATATSQATVTPPTPTPMPTTEESPTAGPTAVEETQIEVLPTTIGQGETAMVKLWGQSAFSATATFDERRYPLVAEDGYFWGIVGAAGDAWSGTHAITVELFNINGDLSTELAASVAVVDMGYPVENIDLPDDVNNSLDPTLVQQENDARADVFAQFTAEKLWSGAFIWPAPQVIVSPYGIRRSYNGGPVNSFHQGIDLAADEGVPVATSNSGRVAYVGSGPVHGNSVLIDHGDGVFSGYNHLSAISVQTGQMVNTGDIVGLNGSTGMATGPHLHWEVVVRGLPVDPVPWTLQSMGY